MSKANSKISVQGARRADFFLLRNVVCIFSWKIALDDKMAQGSWSSSQIGSSNHTCGKLSTHGRSWHGWTILWKDLHRGANNDELPQGNAQTLLEFTGLELGKPKAQLELKLVRDVKSNENFYKYTSSKRKAEENGECCLVGWETL